LYPTTHQQSVPYIYKGFCQNPPIHCDTAQDVKATEENASTVQGGIK
jgi:hypothetical protein